MEQVGTLLIGKGKMGNLQHNDSSFCKLQMQMICVY